jgi:DNA-binding protein YbaB
LHNAPVTFQSGNPEIDRHVGQLFERLSHFQTLQQELTQLKVTAAGANGLVEVTVGPSGNLLGVELNPRAMRLDSSGLGEAVMEAYQDACRQMSERVSELMKPLLPDGMPAGGLVGGALPVMDPDGRPQDPMQAIRDTFARMSERR